MQQNIHMTQTISHQAELLDRADRFRAGATAVKAAQANTRTAAAHGYEVRPIGSDEGEALLLLAQRDDHELPRGHVLGAFSQGRLLAAISLRDGAYAADPFLASGEALGLLQLRARQLGTRPRRRGLRGLLSRGRAGRGGDDPTRAHASLAGSPPGAGGRLLQL